MRPSLDERLEQYSRRAGRTLWWVNGLPELTGAVVVTLAALFIAFDVGNTVVRLVSFILAGGLPYFLHKRFIAPYGGSAAVPQRRTSWVPAGVLVAALVGGAAFAWATDVLPDTTPGFALLAAGFPLALPAVVLYGCASQHRHMLLAAGLALTPVAFYAAPQGGEGWSVLLPISTLAATGLWGLLALVATFRNPPSLEALEEALSSPSPSRRFGAAEFLIGFGEPRAIPALLRAAFDDVPTVRDAARIALWNVWGPDAELRFEWHLEDTGLDKKRVSEVTQEEYAAVKEDFSTAVHNTRRFHDEVRASLRSSLERNAELWELLARLAAEPPSRSADDSPGADGAFRLLAGAGTEEAFELLLSRAVELEEPYFASAIEACEYGDESLMEFLVSHIDGDDVTTARSLSCLHSLAFALEDRCVTTLGERVRGAVFRLADSDLDTAREAAAESLSLVGPDGSETARRLFADECGWVRGAALVSLARIDAADARGHIREALDDPFIPVRGAAVSSIGGTDWGHGARLVERKIDEWLAEMKTAEGKELEWLEALVDQANELVRDVLY